MPKASSRPTSVVGSLVLIAAVVGAGAAAFAYTGGWLTPDRLTPRKLVAILAPPGGPVPGYRRNHSKGICFTGTFKGNGAGGALSTANILSAGDQPVVGRFNLGTPNPKAVDGEQRVRGLSLLIGKPGQGEWRMAMITAPFFPVSTPQAFYDLLVASGKKDDPDAMKTFATAHPEIANFGAWAKSAPFLASYAEERYNSLNSFLFTDKDGHDHAVRWSFVPAAQPEPIAADDLAKQDPSFLETDITQRVATGPQRWTMRVTAANPGDPTADPSKAWPDDRPTTDVGTLSVEKIEAEADGPCRDINFDPTVLPTGVRTSDDPFPAARSAAYSVSFNRRTAEAKDYPRTEGQPQ